MLSKIINYLGRFFLFLALLFLLSCHEKGLKKSYDIDSCLQETLRMLAQSHPKRQMVYKIKEYKSHSYVLYLRFNSQWWYYRTIHEDELIDRDLEVIKCPDYKNSIFKGK